MQPKINLSGEWEPPSPDGDFEPDSTEYWKAKAKLASAAAQELFARAKEMYTTPLTLKDSHPSWQVRKASPPKDDAARGKQRVKGAWGDMDSNQMLEHLNLEEEKEEQKREEAAEKKRDMAERRAEREELERERKEMKQLQLELERPVTDLLKRLSFTEANKDETSAAELSAFARANREQLVALDVDLTSLTKKALMPNLVAKVTTAPTTVAWKSAPMKAIVDKSAAMMPPPPPRSPPVADAFPIAIEATVEPSSAAGTPQKPPEKRTRRGAAPPPCGPPPPPDDADMPSPLARMFQILEGTPTPSSRTSLASTIVDRSPGSSTHGLTDAEAESPVHKSAAKESDEKSAGKSETKAPPGMRAVGKARVILPPKRM